MGKSKYDGAPIQRLLELVRSEDRPKASLWAIARQVAKEHGAENEERFAEGLRRRYRVLRDSGQLPRSYRQAVRDERMWGLLENAYTSRKAAIDSARIAVRRLSRQAKELGITDLGPEGLVDQINEFRRRKGHLERVTSLSEIGVALLMEKKLGSTKAAHEEYRRSVNELDQIKRKLEVISELRENIGTLLAVGEFPQNGET